MKVLFLDIDGVLNPTANGHASNFSKPACANLNKLLRDVPDLKVVVSSSWRHKGLDHICNILDQNGIDVSRVIGITDSKAERRGLQIADWVKAHKVDSFVILDDHGADMAPCTAHLVQVNSYICLTTTDIELAKKLLK